MRLIVLGTFLVDGVAAIWLVASLAFGNGRLTAFDAMIIAALLMGFFTALATIIGADEAKQQLRQHFPLGPVFTQMTSSDALQQFPAEPPAAPANTDTFQEAVN